MAFDLQSMTGMMFSNDFKDSEKHPSFKGTINVHGDIYEVAEWERIGKNSGKPYKFLKLKFQEKQQNSPVNTYQPPVQQQAPVVQQVPQQVAQQAPVQQPVAQPPVEYDLPF